VAYFRERSRVAGGRKLTTQALSARTRELGHPLDRSVIAKLEGGHRQNITVPELLVLAGALDVPPLLLLFPVGRTQEIEMLPGMTVGVWDAVRWLTGELPPGFSLGSKDDSWERETKRLDLFRSYYERLGAWQQKTWEANLAARQLANAENLIAAGEADEEDADARARLRHRINECAAEMRQIEDALSFLRTQMREHNLVPPALYAELEHLDVPPPERAIGFEPPGRSGGER